MIAVPKQISFSDQDTAILLKPTGAILRACQPVKLRKQHTKYVFFGETKPVIASKIEQRARRDSAGKAFITLVKLKRQAARQDIELATIKAKGHSRAPYS